MLWVVIRKCINFVAPVGPAPGSFFSGCCLSGTNPSSVMTVDEASPRVKSPGPTVLIGSGETGKAEKKC